MLDKIREFGLAFLAIALGICMIAGSIAELEKPQSPYQQWYQRYELLPVGALFIVSGASYQWTLLRRWPWEKLRDICGAILLTVIGAFLVTVPFTLTETTLDRMRWWQVGEIFGVGLACFTGGVVRLRSLTRSWRPALVRADCVTHETH
jgi:cell division protein FtsW (lipid II flippase)